MSALKRPDHVVAIAIGQGPIGVGAEVAVRLGVAGGVEPVLAPPLAVAGRGEQALDQPLVGVGTAIVHEGRDLLGGRGQARQVEAEAADQGGAVGLGAEGEPSLLERGLDEAIDGRANARESSHGAGGLGSPSRREGPVIGPRRRGLGTLGRGASPCAPARSSGESGAFSSAGERLFGLRRHLVGRRPASQSPLSSGEPGLDDRPALSAPRQRPGAGEVQLPLGLDRSVALDAAGLEDRLDVAVEGRLRERLPGACRTAATAEQEQACSHRPIGTVVRGRVIMAVPR